VLVTGPRVTVVGDALLDVDWTGRVERVSPDAPVPVLDSATESRRPGGAALAARCAAEAGADVTLVAALGDDDAGDAVRACLALAGVRIVDLGLGASTPVKLRVRAGDQSLVRIDHNCTPVAATGAWTDAATRAVTGAAGVLVADYGRGMAANPVLSVLLGDASGRPTTVWDPHPRGPEPPGGLDLITPNLAEARRLLGAGAASIPPSSSSSSSSSADAVDVAAALARKFDGAVAVTSGSAGAVLAEPGRLPVMVPVEPARGDPCGAGDSFAATVAVERALGTPAPTAVALAVEAARRHVLGLRPTGDGPEAVDAPAEALARIDAWHAAGVEVVAAGGCFDILHAGHVELLQSARRLGGALVVCVNSDLSVRRLKGRHRPVNGVADRVAVLRGLSCVDEVVVFDEDTPCAALGRIRPAVYVKGADYADRELPEAEVLADWGGRTVLLPLSPGRSTTGIIDAAAAG
jgi:rfaE bifunctional protein nucleotidyltransferase chain/domain/rfaE bifunctional protein kinase chain/domain